MIQDFLVYISIGIALIYVLKKTVWDTFRKQKSCSKCTMHKKA